MVATRTREMALRIALGASRTRVLSTVLFDIVKLVMPGVTGGLLIAFGIVRTYREDLGLPLSSVEHLAYPDIFADLDAYPGRILLPGSSIDTHALSNRLLRDRQTMGLDSQSSANSIAGSLPNSRWYSPPFQPDNGIAASSSPGSLLESPSTRLLPESSSWE
jgi:FtsX-like permease family protein